MMKMKCRGYIGKIKIKIMALNKNKYNDGENNTQHDFVHGSINGTIYERKMNKGRFYE